MLSALAVLVAAGWHDPLRALLRLLTTPGGRLGMAATGVVLFAASARLLARVLGRQGLSRVIVHAAPLGEIQVALGAVEGLAYRAGRQVDGVRDLRARVRPSPQGLRVDAVAWVAGDVRVPELCDRLQQAIRQRIQHALGVEVGEVRVTVREIGGEQRHRRIE